MMSTSKAKYILCKIFNVWFFYGKGFLLIDSVNLTGMNHGRRMGGQGAKAPLDFEIFSKKWLFSWFWAGKIKFHHFWSPLEKFQKNLLVPPLWKNPSDAHGVSMESDVFRQNWTLTQSLVTLLQCRINHSSKCSNCYRPRAFGGPAVFCNKFYLLHYI